MGKNVPPMLNCGQTVPPIYIYILFFTHIVNYKLALSALSVAMVHFPSGWCVFRRDGALSVAELQLISDL